MKLLTGILGLTLTSVVALASANAADIYRAPEAGGYKDGPAYVAVDWSGLYVGVNGGYGWSDNSFYEGGFGGGQIGYNIQRGTFVFGLETDFEASGITGGGINYDYFGTVRGRAGVTFDRALLYATGGFAYGDVSFPGFSHTETGYVVGGGLEYKLTPQWSGKIEYQYIDLDSSHWEKQINTIRVGVNYFVGGGYVPLK